MPGRNCPAYGKRKPVLIRNGKISGFRLSVGIRYLRSGSTEPADIRAVAERELYADNITVGEIAVGKSYVRKNVVDAVHPSRPVRECKFAEIASPVFNIIVRIEKRHRILKVRYKQ